MESEGGGIVVAAAAPTTSRRLSTQRSSLRDTFIASDLADGINTATIVSPRPVSNVTLGAVLGDKKSPPPNNTIVRTLLDIIHNDETLSIGGGSPNSNKSWKSFKERLKRRKSQSRNTRRWASSVPVPQSDVDTVVPSEDVSLMEVDRGRLPGSSGSFRLSAILAAEREETRRRLSREMHEDVIDSSDIYVQGNRREAQEGNVEANQPIRMSLMDLLEDTDLQTGISGPSYRLGEKDDEVDDEGGAPVEELGKGELSCCVCMVRRKGAAFIPCGHTFCRLCCQELFLQRRNCPLCNNFILEILNIF